MNGSITNIQRFSLNDGPGIRSTVFFQGCNMHCEWCHNPETLPVKPVLMHYPVKCIGCWKCFEVCPVQAHRLEDNKHTIDRACCTGCGSCADMCFAEALVMSSREYTVDEVVAEVIQDKLYYEKSGGGVTLSGGEVGMQADFAVELVRALHDKGISVALETNLAFSYEYVAALYESVDIIMCDIKIFDGEEHRKHTGVDNARIMENAKRVATMGIPIIVRTPLIPGVCDSLKNINSIINFVAQLPNVLCYELLSFNPLGGTKYTALDAENRHENDKPQSRSALEQLCSQLNVPQNLKLVIS